MSVYYLSSVDRKTHSGGGKFLFSNVAILNANGFDAKIIWHEDLETITWDKTRDVIVFPEVWGDWIGDFVPGVKKISFAQNGYLIDERVANKNHHPYVNCKDLIAIMAESEHTKDIIETRFPNLKVPIFRIRPSANTKNGEDAGFHYGPWPRERSIVFFEYKHKWTNRQIFTNLNLPLGWQVNCLTGISDKAIQRAMRRASIFVAANKREGMCAPTAEAMISGCVNVCWTGKGPEEYLLGRGVIAEQDNVTALREAIAYTAADISKDWTSWAKLTEEWSTYFTTTYSRENEAKDICNVFESLGFK